ncbi:helix-turn-helix transcriptional regulator [Henriciella litoralis]|uniref:helix-turn-helix transcriptional regulator n=1 Tax=Henriciella litoralis TaxID=568102 RepID=UPI000A06AABF|nr:LuxR C-terminal-related transcriptional regulator [Henriciella litoralis]
MDDTFWEEELECVEYLKQSNFVDSKEELREVTGSVLERLGFSDFMLTEKKDVPQLGFGKFDSTHMEAYIKERMYLVDPVHQKLSTSWLPVFWECKDYLDREPCAQLFEKSRAVGYEAGVSVIIRGPIARTYTFTCMASSQDRSTFQQNDENYGCVLTIANALCQAYTRLGRTSATAISLTPRERQCLILAMKGKTAWESAKIMNIRERTVTFHVQNAMMKMGTPSKHLAWIKAADLGLLEEVAA